MIWEKAYRYWATHRGLYTSVKKLRYIGLRGWKGYIQKKEYDGVYYAGEIYECLTPEGLKIKAVFRVPYEDVGETYKKEDNESDHIIEDRPNYHTDGIRCWDTGNYRFYDNRQLKRREQELQDKISRLKEIFRSLNNIDTAELKLAVQLYLRRLETPDHFSSKDWKNCTIKQQVLNLL